MFRPERKGRLQFLSVPQEEGNVLYTRFAPIKVHSYSASRCMRPSTGRTLVAKHNCPTRFAAFATMANTVSAAFERVVPFLERPVNIALPFDRLLFLGRCFFILIC
jgi:hypothetical protein